MRCGWVGKSRIVVYGVRPLRRVDDMAVAW